MIRRKNWLIRITQILIIMSLLLIWQLLADKGIINTFITSSPKEAIKTIIQLHNQHNLYNHIAITIWETFISFIISVIMGIIIATILWSSNFIARVLDPYLTILNSLPKVALGPIIIIWAGAKMKSIIIMALLISLIITIINVYQAFISVDENKIKLMKTLKASKQQIFFKLILPSSFSSIISTLKINISMSLIGS